jgi:flagellar assembly protein FliH
VQVFQYRPVGSDSGPLPPNDNIVLFGDPQASGPPRTEKNPPSPGISDAEMKAREKCAWEKGFQEGEAEAREQFQKQLATQEEAIAAAVKDFSKDRTGYYQRVEEEVIKLVLAVARRILHREAHVDPLLLAGVVHVGLEKITKETNVRLRVHPDTVCAWHSFFANRTGDGPTPEIIGDPLLETGRCALETSLGTTELGLDTQLAEIETGFLDLLAQKPQAA